MKEVGGVALAATPKSRVVVIKWQTQRGSRCDFPDRLTHWFTRVRSTRDVAPDRVTRRMFAAVATHQDASPLSYSYV